MKLIQAMKKLKDLNAKAADLRAKVQQNCADLTIETPAYADQKRQVGEWIQAHHDILKEILGLRVAIQRTNLATKVSVELDGKHIVKSIAEWIHRRRDLAKLEQSMWAVLGDRNLKEQNVQTSPGGPVTEVRIRRYFDAVERDKNLEVFRSEPSVIDATLEVVNATTELVTE
jgi:ribonuclease HI